MKLEPNLRAPKIIAISTMAVLLGTGCGGTKREPVPLDSLPTELAAALCASIESCTGPFIDAFMPDCAVQFAKEFSNDRMAAWAPAFAAGTMVYDELAARDCVDIVRADGCALVGGGRLPEPCHRALGGQVQVGNACHQDEECAGDAYCDTAAGCPGVCASLLAANAPCTRGEQCALGLTCRDSSGRCAAPTQPGDPCEGGVAPQCEGALVCIGADAASSTPGRCAYLADLLVQGEGMTCAMSTGQLCVSGLSCVVGPMAPTCEQLQSMSGGVCPFALPDTCPRGDYCDAAPGAQGMCTSLPAEGGACLQDGPYPACAAGFACGDGNQCVSRSENGQPCDQDVACYSGHCDPSTSQCSARQCAQ